MYNQDLLPPVDPAHAHASSHTQAPADEGYTLSRFGSRFPSLQPEDMTDESGTRKRPLADISHNDRKLIEYKLESTLR